jgi:hypothetical protein
MPLVFLVPFCCLVSTVLDASSGGVVDRCFDSFDTRPFSPARRGGVLGGLELGFRVGKERLPGDNGASDIKGDVRVPS